MFVVEVGSVITTVLLIRASVTSAFRLQPADHSLALVHGAVCQLRGGDGRRPRQGTGRHLAASAARKPWPSASLADGKIEEIPSAKLRAGDLVTVDRWRVYSGRRGNYRRRGFGGRIGHHGRVRARDSRGWRRPLGRDRRHARSSATDQGEDHVESRRDFSRPHDRAGGRRSAAEDAKRNRAEYSAGWTDDYFFAGRGHAAAVCDLFRIAANRVRAGLAAGVPDSHYHWRTALGDRHCRHGPPGAAQRACHVRTRSRSGGRREHACCSTRPEPSRLAIGKRTEFIPAPGISEAEMADAAQLSSLADETPEGRSIVVLAKEKYELRGRELASHEAEFIPFTAQTRMSGVNLDGREIRKGAVDAITKYLRSEHATMPERSSCRGRTHCAFWRNSAGGGGESPGAGRDSSERHCERRNARALRSSARHGHSRP